jgi:hypothetical protein
MLKELNRALQKFNTKVAIPINRLNALNKARKGDTKSIEKIFENKIRRKGFNYLKKLF